MKSFFLPLLNLLNLLLLFLFDQRQFCRSLILFFNSLESLGSQHCTFLPVTDGIRRQGIGGFQCFEVLECGQAIGGEDICLIHVIEQRFNLCGDVVYLSEVGDDGDEVVVLLLHFLVMTAALFGLPCAHEQLHGLEDLVHASHVSIHEMLVVDL